MPRFTELTADDRQKLAQQGINPDEGDYILDSETGDVWPRADAPSLGVLGQIGEGVRAYAPGIAKTLLVPFKAAGSTADLIRRGLGTYDPKDPSALTTVADESLKNVQNMVGEPDARAHWLAKGLGEGAGQLTTLLGGSALGALAYGPKALAGISGVAGGVGGLMNAQSTLDRELARQDKLGINRPGLAATKAAGAGVLGAATDIAFGPGRLIRSAGQPTTVGGALLRAGANALSGGATEGVQQGTEDFLVEGKLDPANELRAATIGALVQPAAGLAVDLPLHKEAEAVTKPAGPGRKPMELAKDQPPQINAPIANPELPAIMAALRSGEKWDPPGKTGFDKAIASLQEKKVVLNEDDINDLFSAQADENALGVKVRELFARDVANRAAKPRPVVEQIGAELGIRNKYDAVRKDLEGRLEKMSKDLEKDPRLGNQAIFVAKQKLFQDQLDKLTQQEEVELGALQSAQPVEGMTERRGLGLPVVASKMGERVGQGQGPTYTGPERVAPIIQGEVIDVGGELQAPRVPLQLPERSGPSVDPAAAEMARQRQLAADQERALLSGQLQEPQITGPAVPSLANQRLSERAILGGAAKPENPALQEGEQSYPFGEGQTRYSTILPPSLLSPAQHAARRLRQYADEGQLQAGTFMLSGVAALNDEKPLGIMLNSAGELPTAGLVNKFAANVPKVEMDIYKQNGLEEFLNGRKGVSKDELQAWMLENGPKVEIKELRPYASDPAAKRKAAIEHELDTVMPDWRTEEKTEAEWNTFYAANPRIAKLIKERGDLERQIIHTPHENNSTIGRYGVEPRPVEEMEGPVELLVRVPFSYKPFRSYKRDANENIIDPAERKEALNAGPMFTGGHHGESGYNTLGFTRANVETLPDGRKVLHLFEVQSDWGHAVREQEQQNKARIADHLARMRPMKDDTGREGYIFTSDRGEFWAPTKEALLKEIERSTRITSDTPTHPLLAEDNRLPIKAAIQYAIDNGLDGIAISDADTAMITEKHDQIASMVKKVTPEDIINEANSFAVFGFDEDIAKEMYGPDWRNGIYARVTQDRNRKTVRIDKPEANRRNVDLARELKEAGYGQKEGIYIPQEDGMRLNYDNRLQKIAGELTGQKGERVSFGEHHNAMEEKYVTQMSAEDRAELRVQHQFNNLGDAGIQALTAKYKVPRKDLVLKNPDGSPKTDITAFVYPIDKVRKMRAENSAFTVGGRDKSYYSLFGPSKETLDNLRKFVGESIPALRDNTSFDPYYVIGRATTAMMAAQNPTGALLKYKFDTFLQTDRDANFNQLVDMIAPAEKFLKSERGKQWARTARDKKSWDMTGLTDEEQTAALALKEFIEFTRNYANQEGVYVHEVGDDGKMTYRPGKLVPGYTPAEPGQQVYDTALEGGQKWLDLREDFIQNWRKHFGPGSDAMAEAAMEKMIPSLGKNKNEGEPLFSPVILPKGIDLPKSWQSESIWDGLMRYSRRYAQHMAWAKNIQNTPEGRAAFGLKMDAQGRPDTKPITWADHPDAWLAAVREGKRAYALWARDADPDSPPNSPIVAFYNPALVDAMLGSYKQGSSDSPTLQAAGQLASRALLGTFAGMRDAGMGAVTAAVYGDVATATRRMLDYVTGGRGKQIEGARRAGAITGDVLEQEAIGEGGRFARGMMKTARFLGRWVSGREEMDRFGKVLLFDTIMNLPEGQRQKMIEEFGPVENMDPAQALEYAAARISRRASNTSTAENLPPMFLPQATGKKGAVGQLFGLMRWSIGQWNNFKEDVVGPMYQGKTRESLERFFKLTIGTVVVGSIINAVVDALMDRKPNHMTWGEWLNLAMDEKVPIGKKIDELAYTTLANMQLSGAFGWAGDMALAGVRKNAGGKSVGDPLDAQYPLLILGSSWAKTLNSYAQAVANKRAGPEDFGQLLQEMMAATQNGRVVNKLAEVTGLDTKEIRKPVRDSELVKRVFEVNPKTGRDIKPAAGMLADMTTDPFSAQRQAMRIPEGEYRNRLGGFLRDYRAPDGRPFTLNRWNQWPGYYKELERLVGKEEAEKAKKEAAELDKTITKKNRALIGASR